MSQHAIFLIISLTIRVSAQIHTQFFLKNWNLIGNNNSYFFDNRTLGIGYPIDPCTSNSKMGNHKFRHYVNLMTECTDQWCVDDEFKCIKGDLKRCYDTDHIIHPDGPELPGYNKNIFGNLVMSSGIWNQQMRRLLVKNYSALREEKEIVYSSSIIERVRKIVITCQETSPDSRKLESLRVFAIICVAFIFVCCCGITLSFIENECRRKSCCNKICEKCQQQDCRSCCDKVCSKIYNLVRKKCRKSYTKVDIIEVEDGHIQCQEVKVEPIEEAM